MVAVITIYYNYAVHRKHMVTWNARAVKKTRDLGCHFFSNSWITIIIFTVFFSPEGAQHSFLSIMVYTTIMNQHSQMY